MKLSVIEKSNPVQDLVQDLVLDFSPRAEAHARGGADDGTLRATGDHVMRRVSFCADYRIDMPKMPYESFGRLVSAQGASMACFWSGLIQEVTSENAIRLVRGCPQFSIALLNSVSSQCRG
jgi:hypothetical protein